MLKSTSLILPAPVAEWLARRAKQLGRSHYSWLRPSRLVIVRIRWYRFVIQEIACILGCTHMLEGPGCLIQMEEASQISRRTAVGKRELTFWNPEVMLDETQNAAEVIPKIANITCRRVG